MNLNFKIFDLKLKIPNKQNNKKFIFIIKFPKIKLIGKKPKTMFVSKTGLIFKFLVKIIIV